MAQRKKTPRSSAGSGSKGRNSKTGKRTGIEPHKGDRRYVRRSKKGRFKTEVNVGRSLSADRRRKAKTKVGKGQGDRGDTGSGIIAKVKKVLGV